jgi:transposase-like protein
MYKPFNCPYCGKLIPEHILNGDLKRKPVACPECGSINNCKAGKRKTKDGRIQSYLCKDCGRRFT